MVSYVPEGMWSAERYSFLQAHSSLLICIWELGLRLPTLWVEGWMIMLLDMPLNVFTTCSERTFAVRDETMEKAHNKGMGLFIYLGKGCWSTRGMKGMGSNYSFDRSFFVCLNDGVSNNDYLGYVFPPSHLLYVPTSLILCSNYFPQNVKHYCTWIKLVKSMYIIYIRPVCNLLQRPPEFYKYMINPYEFHYFQWEYCFQSLHVVHVVRL